MTSPVGALVNAWGDGEDIDYIWTAGLTGQGMGLRTEPTQKAYPKGHTLGNISSLYAVSHDSLGKGSYGVVYHCHHKSSNVHCAIKCVSKACVDDSYLEEHLKRDMFTLLLTMSCRCHPNVVRYLDFLMGPSTVYVVMELLDGEELLDTLMRTAVTESFCRDVARQGLSALEYIHSFGIIHRDVKLNALRFRKRGPAAELVLFDFGHCCQDSNRTMNIVGTVLYIAPEVFSSGQYTTQVDLWALGVVVYVVLTGVVPFEFQGSPRAVSAEALQAALDINEVRALPPQCADFLTKLLVESPRMRPSATAALEHPWFAQTDSIGFKTKKEAYLAVHETMKAAVAVSMPAKTRRMLSLELETTVPLRRSWDINVANAPAVSMVSKAPLRAPLDINYLRQIAFATVFEGATGIRQNSEPQGLTYNEAVITMIMNGFGSTLVLFPKIMSDVGILIALLLCVICALICNECGEMLIVASSMAETMLCGRIRTYEELALFSAPRCQRIMQITKNASLIGFLVVYVHLVLQSIAAFFPEAGTEEKEHKRLRKIRICFVFPCFCILCMIKDLKQLARFSVVGILSVFLVCGCIMLGAVFIMLENRPQCYFFGPNINGEELREAMGASIAIFLFSFAVLGTVPSVRSQLQDPSDMPSVLRRSLIALVFLKCIVMTIGYLAFGNETADNVVVGIKKKYPILGDVAALAVLVNVLLSSPIYFFCILSAFESSGTDAIRTPMAFPNIGVRILLVCGLCFVDEHLPYVREIIGLVSSVFVSCNNVFFPALFHYNARQKMGASLRYPWAQALKYNVALLVGLSVLIFGFKGSLKTLLRKVHDDALKVQNGTISNGDVVSIIFE